MDRFFVITNIGKDKNLEITNQIKDYLQRKGKQCFLPDTDKYENTCRDSSYGNGALIPGHVDCVIVLGGDGTLLQAARDINGRNIPILGINLGTLGYLTEIDKNNINYALDCLIKDEFETENRMMLDGKIFHEDTFFKESSALNDIVIYRTGALRVINFTIYVNGKFLNNYNADGIIIATPTGSTGYNLSAGGPIVDPKAEITILTPICPHTLNTRSIVLPASDVIEIEIGEGRKSINEIVNVNFDGTDTEKLTSHDRIKITKSIKRTNLVKVMNRSFLEVLCKKMQDQ